MNWNRHKKQLLQNSKFKKALEEARPEYEIARAMISARKKHQLTQKQLAEKIGTKQSVISRVENMQTTATVSFLNRFAKVFGGNLKIKFIGVF